LADKSGIDFLLTKTGKLRKCKKERLLSDSYYSLIIESLWFKNLIRSFGEIGHRLT